MGKESSFDFEKSIKQLEDIVSHMEENTLSIEVALVEFEKGIKIIRNGQKALQQAEQKIKVLIDKQGESVLENYTSDIQDVS